MEWKFWYGIWKIPYQNGMEDNLSYFHTNSVRVHNQGVEPNLNPIVNPNEPFHFGEPEPNLNQQNFTLVNPNQT